MTEIKPCPRKTHADLVREWDQLADERHRQITSGEDISFEHVIVPTTWRLFEGADPSVVLDVGSGTGDFTAQLSRVAGKVIGVEPSSASIALARKVCQSLHNVRFIEAPLEEAASTIKEGQVTAALAVMTLMTAPDLRLFAKALAGLLPAQARFIATIAHPCFWHRYR